MSRKKKMNIEEFVEWGYLQEVNRRFLHPLGLQLEVGMGEEDEDGNTEMVVSGVWDKRSIPEGLLLDEVEREKVLRVTNEMNARRPARRALPECHNNGLQKAPRG